MGLEEPEVFVQLPRDLGEEVSGVLVAGLVGFVDRGSHAVGVDAVALDERPHVVDTGVDVGRDLRQAGAGRGHAHRAQRVTAELGRPLGKLVGLALPLLRQLVEEQVQLIEVDALHIPVRLLGLAVEIGRVGQLLVEELDHRNASRGGKVDRRLEGPVDVCLAVAFFHEANLAFLFDHAASAPFVSGCRVQKSMCPGRHPPSSWCIGYPARHVIAAWFRADVAANTGCWPCIGSTG